MQKIGDFIHTPLTTIDILVRKRHLYEKLVKKAKNM